jgi:hypothetical protein
MKLVEAGYGMKGMVCASCFERPENCIGCEWHNCAICGEELSDSEAYEYRGAIACATHHDEMIEKRDYQRQQIIENTDKQIRSQADGEWMNGGYKTMKTGADGRPITKVREPQAIKDYEDGKL